MLVKAVAETDGCRLVAAVEREGSIALGEDAGLLAGVAKLAVPITDDPAAAFAKADGVLDFSTPAATVAFAELAARDRLVHVVGTTGLAASDLDALRKAAGRSRVIQSGNMSLGVNLLAGLVRKVAATLGQNFDVEILEMHHRTKVDAPSGTALLLGEAVAEGRNVNLDERRVAARDGHTGARRAGDIGFAVLRGGSVVGDHTVMFAGAGERLELTHRAEDRSIFARGAIKAAMWGYDRDPGFYTMADVLGLSSL
jgi:4-hydroxy-tetrahydrodipicolinate reductase